MGWCKSHGERLVDCGGKLAAQALVIKSVIETLRASFVEDCWACALTADQFDQCLVRGALITAQADAQGGEYTTDELALVRGKRAE